MVKDAEDQYCCMCIPWRSGYSGKVAYTVAKTDDTDKINTGSDIPAVDKAVAAGTSTAAANGKTGKESGSAPLHDVVKADPGSTSNTKKDKKKKKKKKKLSLSLSSSSSEEDFV